ncbi:hypothetical protein MHF_0472 [Mycoplasma haemofelis Ohio2]|uniref:Uncharacterized protein n=1 Tax=Mycoplasma haemofelis (strain Ohio2) TaxID=859194 RepID=F6FHK5_MYCHI|nr:hypothetical protein MHF_0472 [Mycoplasma haemofelis Ohio2]
MVLTPAQMACGLGAACAVGTGSYFALTRSSGDETPKIKLSEQLVKDGFTLLNFEDGNQAEWTTILEKYKAGSKEKFEGLNLLGDGEADHANKNIASLKGFCKALVGATDFSKSYNKARRWCVVPKKVSEIFTTLKKTVLKNEDSQSENNDQWKIKIGSYDGKALPISGVNWSQTGETEQIKALKKGCKDLFAKDVKTYDDAFEEDYRTAERWCIAD